MGNERLRKGAFFICFSLNKKFTGSQSRSDAIHFLLCDLDCNPATLYWIIQNREKTL